MATMKKNSAPAMRTSLTPQIKRSGRPAVRDERRAPYLRQRGVPAAADQCVGEASCQPHFGEVVQGAVEVEKNGRPAIVRCLVSLHMPTEIGSVAQFRLVSGTSKIQVAPSHYTKCLKAARLMLDRLGLQNSGGVLQVRTLVPEGAGMGSSTSGVVAAMRAVAAAAGRAAGTTIALSPRLQADVAVAAEQASDSIMFDCTGTTLLFEHRTGLVRRTLGGALPRMLILGFDTAADGVDTDALPRARYSSEQIASFSVALATLERGIKQQSVDLIGRVATFSATVNQAHLPKPNFDALVEVSKMVGSAGIVVAHSGTVAGLIFDAALTDLAARTAEAEALVKALGFRRFRKFTTPF
jgi:uncharacterized protein involved in propanediol utilization